MNKKKYMALILILSLFCIDKVHAESCELKIIREFEKISSRYEVSYRYNIEKESYTLILKHSTNPNYTYKIYDIENIECEQINLTTKECHNFKPGRYSYAINGKNDECSTTVRGTYVEIKELQNYSSDPLCNGIEEFVLCQEDYYKELDYDTFVSRVNLYKKTKQEKTEEKIKQQNTKEETVLSKIISFIEKNTIIILIVVILIISILIGTIVMIKSAKKSRRLE